MGNRSEDDCSSNSDDQSRRKRKRSKQKSSSSSSKKRKSKKDDRKKRRRRNRSKRRDDSDDSSSDNNSSKISSDSSHYERRRKERKKEKKREKKRKTRRLEEGEAERRSQRADDAFERRNYEIADSLLKLLSEHPSIASELSIMLIRLAGGTSFDLSQMTDSRASRGLAQVFASLQSFGVVQDATSGCWVWHSPKPGGGGGLSLDNELLLIRIVRSVLDQIGITTQAIDSYEDSLNETAKQEPVTNIPLKVQEENLSFERAVSALLLQFGPDKFAGELAGLCNMILEGESISLDSLPDEKLHNSLETLFVACGLEKSEMEVESDEDEASGKQDGESAMMGYALPDANEESSRAKLAAVLKVCREGPKNSRRPIQGPLMDPSAYSAAAEALAGDDSSEGEGPVPRGTRRKGPTLPPGVMEAQAARSVLEYEYAKAGIAPPVDGGPLGREEWMLVPGKFDFLGSIKSGQPMKGRTFEAKNKSDSETQKKVMDPAVQAEIDEIMQAHEEARGPSLIDLHRQKKAEESLQEGGGKKAWKWNRDKDLEAGRGVDKNALNMLFGGASSDLKNKFHGGFG